MRCRSLDLATLVAVAATATDVPPPTLITGTDIALLAMIAERVRAQPNAADAVAEVLVGIAASRPFPRHNSVAAWALAAHVALCHRRRLKMEPVDAAAVVRASRDGGVSEAEVACLLDSDVLRSMWRPLDVFERIVAMPPGPPAMQRACPECGRTLMIPPSRSSIFYRHPLPQDVITDCSIRYRTHQRGVRGFAYSTAGR